MVKLKKGRIMKLFYVNFLNNSVFMGAFISIISSSITLVLQAFIVNFFKDVGKPIYTIKPFMIDLRQNLGGFTDQILMNILMFLCGSKFTIQKVRDRL